MKVTEGKEWMPQTQQEENTVQFNYYFEGELINTKYRDGKKNFKLTAGAPKIFYNLDGIVNTDSAIIVEGEIDALSCIEAGYTNVVSVPNGATKHSINLDYLDSAYDIFEEKTKIILAIDNDEVGQMLQQEFIRRLGAERCYLADFGELKDANEYLIEHGTTKLASVINDAPQCPLEDVYVASDIQEDLEDYLENGAKSGFQIGLPEFDDVFSTYTSQFITVTGIPTHGKSDFIDRMCVGYNKKYGWKTAYASPENLPMHIHVDKIMRKVAGERTKVGTEEYQNAFNIVNDNFYFIGMDRYYLEDILEKGAELVKRKGIKVLVLDPFNKVKMKGVPQDRVSEYTLEYLQRLDEFAKKYDVLVIIAAHPTKMYKDQQGKTEMPSFYNVKGGSEWFDASYHGLVVYRDFEANTTTVKVLKVKFQNLGTNGAEVVFTWEKEAGQFIPVNQLPQNVDDAITPKRLSDAFDLF